MNGQSVALSITFQHRVNERYVRYVTDRQSDKLQKLNISACKMYSTICVEWTADHYGLGLT